MKTAEEFWSIIANYNQNTLILQITFSVFILISVIVASKKRLIYLPKVALFISNLFIAIYFFFILDKSKIGLFFAGPLFILISFFFLYDSIKNKYVEFNPFSGLSIPVLVLTLSYPLISFILGHKYPNQVLYILPCPLISLSIVIYSRYKIKSFLLMVLMIIWALTGIKAFIFNALEDLILFIIGIYGIYIIVKEVIKKRKTATNNAFPQGFRLF